MNVLVIKMQFSNKPYSKKMKEMEQRRGGKKKIYKKANNVD